MRECDENNEQIFRKTNNEIEENDQKIEKNDRKDKRHDWRKYLNKDNDQTIDDYDFNVFYIISTIFRNKNQTKKWNWWFKSEKNKKWNECKKWRQQK